MGRVIGDGVVDSGHAALYLRQLLRGNRAPPSVRARGTSGAGPSESRWPSLTQSANRARSAAVLADTPVLLLHGYLATRGSVHLLEQRLTQAGHVVMTYRLGAVQMGDIRTSAGFIARKVDSLCAQTGVEKVDIVAHSMGGLVALDYLKRLNGHTRVRRLVLLGTPVQGTWSALMSLMTAPLNHATVQLLPGSVFLRELAASPLPAGPEVTVVAAERDWLAPPRTTDLAGARRFEVPTGHSGLLVDERVADLVSQLLRGAPVEAPSPAGTTSVV
jgi:pimeloyl-ACP methyl ester carboxylesterase